MISGANRLRTLISVCWIIAIGLGAFQAFDTRHYVNPDGLSYLDMADAYIRGDWNTALNAYWSPLYSWFLSLAFLILHPSLYCEASVVHLINFLIYLCSLGCFHFFLTQLIRYNNHPTMRHSEKETQSLPEWAWIVLGYSLFVWTSIHLITLRQVTPDMCVAAVVYLVSGLLFRIRMGFLDSWIFILLGAAFGLGYLAKAPFLPIALLFFGSSIFYIKKNRNGWLRLLSILFTFLVISTPFITALSKIKGHFTIGSSGRLNYAWYVNNTSRWIHWQGEEPNSGTPKHPTRKIYHSPNVYEFETPIKGTYPAWYDPTYWNEGISPYFDIKKQFHVLIYHIKNVYFDLFFRYQISLVVGTFLLLLISRPLSSCLMNIARQWSILLPAITAMTMYALIHAEPRFISAYIVLFWAGLLSGIRFKKTKTSENLSKYIIVAIVIVMTVVTFSYPVKRVNQIFRELSKNKNPWPHKHHQMAQGLKQIGIHSGDKVAFIGHTFDAYWARLAEIQIVAEIPEKDAETFWRADSTTKTQVFKVFSETNAKAIVTTEIPTYAAKTGWDRINNLEYFVHKLIQYKSIKKGV